MRLVFAGPGSHELLVKCGVRNYLISQFNSGEVKAILKIADLIDKPSLIVDSGAYSAWNSGKEIQKERYLKFILDFRKQHGHKFSELYFVNLDIIPGERNRKPTEKECLEAARGGWRNYMWFKSEGVETIHVYHQGEPLEVLQAMIAEKIPYIGVSPANDSPNRMEFLDFAFRYVPDGIKTHGFGVTSPELMYRYPWFSVDSIRYRIASAMGTFFIHPGDGKEDLIMFRHSDRGSEITWTQSKSIQEYLYKLDPSFELNKMKYSYQLREHANILAFLKLEALVNRRPCNKDYCNQQLLF